jgi:predicted RNA-binding protein with RPS1 domain
MATYNNPIVGDIIRVKITGIKPELGAFARMPNGVDGLIRLHDIAWSNQSVVLSTLSVGDVLDVKVVKELSDGKLNLSVTQLE